MAVEAKAKERSLKLKVQTGTNSSGNPTYGTRTLGDVNLSVSEADLHALATEAAALTYLDVSEIRVADSYMLLETA